jgi:hypothetical protein
MKCVNLKVHSKDFIRQRRREREISRQSHINQAHGYWISDGLLCKSTALLTTWLLAMLGQQSFRECSVLFQRTIEESCTDVFQDTISSAGHLFLWIPPLFTNLPYNSTGCMNEFDMNTSLCILHSFWKVP